jgi:Zn-dependent protease with chaperone function
MLGPAPPPPASAGGLTLDELLAALPERIEPVQRCWAFRLRLTVALITLLAVLAVYVGLVVVTSYGVWCHFASDEFAAAVQRLFGGRELYLAFCVAGPILCVFLVKPIFTLRRGAQSGVALDRAAEPRLFAYVDRLCAAQRAPAPRRIRVDTDINASAALRHGLLSLWFRRDVELTIGLPLVRAMTLRELTGVLAHEFGHFAQGGAMRLSYLTRVAIDFMLRIAYVRDGFDALLIELSQFRVVLDPRITLAVWMLALFMLAIQGFLWLARALMTGLARVALAATGALLREMEYDADRHEARVAGSESFARVGHKLVVLGAARQAAGSLQERWWQGRRLADDVPALVVAAAARLEARPADVQQILEQALAQKTGWFDTHPALRDRLASAAHAAEPGAITLEAPASVLFSDLEALSRCATGAEYRQMLGPTFERAILVPVAELIKEVEGDPDVSALLMRFTHGCPQAAGHVALRPLDTAAADEAAPRDEAIRSLEAARLRVQELAPAGLDAARRLEELRTRHAKLDLTAALMKAFTVTGAPAPDHELAVEAKRQAAVEIHATTRALEPLAEALGDRLCGALRLRQAPEVVALLDGAPGAGAADPTRCALLASTLAGFGRVRDERDRLRSRLLLLRGLGQHLASEPDSIRIERRASEISGEVVNLVKTIRKAIDAVPYPFPTTAPKDGGPSRPVLLGAHLGPVFSVPDVAGTYNQGVELLAQLGRLEERILQSLIATAEQVESALGLPPLPDPPPPSSEAAPA